MTVSRLLYELQGVDTSLIVFIPTEKGYREIDKVFLHAVDTLIEFVPPPTELMGETLVEVPTIVEYSGDGVFLL